MDAHHVRHYGPLLVLGPGALIAGVLVAALGCPSPKKAPPKPQPDDGALVTIPDDAPTNASTCEDRLGFARETMDELVEAAQTRRGCTADSECTTVFAETRCFGACEVAIPTALVVDFRQAQAAIDQRVCTGYVTDGCSYSGPRCINVEAVCEQGRCALKQEHG